MLSPMSSSTLTPYAPRPSTLRKLVGARTFFARTADGVENSETHERDARLERNRRKRELLRLGNGLKRTNARGPVVADHRS